MSPLWFSQETRSSFCIQTAQNTRMTRFPAWTDGKSSVQSAQIRVPKTANLVLEKATHVNVSLALQNASPLLYFRKLELTFTAHEGSLFTGTIACGTAQPPRASQRGSFLYLPSPILGEGRVRVDLNRHWRINIFLFSEDTHHI